MKEGGGGDHLSVGVKTPGSRRIRPVSKRDIFTRPPSKGFSCQRLQCLTEKFKKENANGNRSDFTSVFVTFISIL